MPIVSSSLLQTRILAQAFDPVSVAKEAKTAPVAVVARSSASDRKQFEPTTTPEVRTRDL